MRRGTGQTPRRRERTRVASLRHRHRAPPPRELEQELLSIRRDFEAIVRDTAHDPEWLRFRLENIESAIRSAREIKDGIGGVYIG